MGPVIEPPRGKLLRGLTELERGESWMLEPSPLNEERTLWSPGIRRGVTFGSPAHLTEFFGPMLSVMEVPTLDAAITAVNAVDYGLTSGLHSLDAAEIDHWLAHIDAGNLYVNRGITGAIVRRQPFGGWKLSAVGPGAKAGGPHYVERLTDWVGATDPGLTDAEWLAVSAESDAEAVATTFAATDVTALECERNVLRFVPARTEVRVGMGAPDRDVIRVASAAALASPGTTVTFAAPPDAALAESLTAKGLRVVTEPDDVWSKRITSQRWARVRALGDIPASARSASVTLFADPVTAEGRLELFPFLREQAISMTAHRFGTPAQLAQDVALAASRSAS